MKNIFFIFLFFGFFAHAQIGELIFKPTSRQTIFLNGTEYKIADKGSFNINDSAQDIHSFLASQSNGNSLIHGEALNISASILSAWPQSKESDSSMQSYLADYIQKNNLGKISAVPTSLFSSTSETINTTEQLGGVAYTSYQNRTKEFFNSKKETLGFAFFDHELTNDYNDRLPIITTSVSSVISSQLPAQQNNGAYILKQALYREDFEGTDNIPWASFSAPTKSNGVSLTLFTGVNHSDGNDNGSFIINTGNNNFVFSANKSQAFINWSGDAGSRLIFSSGLISTNALFQTKASIRVLDQSNDELPLSLENLQGYFISNKNASTGLLVQNNSNSPYSTSGIFLSQSQTTNWIGTYSNSSISDFYSPGSLVIQSQGNGGVLLSASPDLNGAFGSIRFGFNMNEFARFTANTFLLGTNVEIPSSIFTMQSTTQGFIPPRLTSQQRKNIKHPEEALTVYDTDLKAFCFWNGNQWRVLCSKEAD
jgi:hypothetical protein